MGQTTFRIKKDIHFVQHLLELIEEKCSAKAMPPHIKEERGKASKDIFDRGTASRTELFPSIIRKTRLHLQLN